MAINLDKLTAINLYEQPYKWAYSQQLFIDNMQESLASTFPSEHYELCHTLRDDKSYKMYHRTIFDNRDSSSLFLDGFSQEWINLIHQLLSNEYITCLSSCLNHDLSRYHIELNLWQYKNGGWLSPHTDKPAKVASQLFYFNQEWDPNWGGSFRVLKSDNIDDYYAEIFPASGNSIILVRCDNSWHAVTAQTCPPQISRNVLQLIFWDHSK